jgi:hypothetical protein
MSKQHMAAFVMFGDEQTDRVYRQRVVDLLREFNIDAGFLPESFEEITQLFMRSDYEQATRYDEVIRRVKMWAVERTLAAAMDDAAGDCTLRVTQVAKQLKIKTWRVEQLVKSGDLSDNGKTYQHRRISASSLARYKRHLNLRADGDLPEAEIEQRLCEAKQEKRRNLLRNNGQH